MKNVIILFVLIISVSIILSSAFSDGQSPKSQTISEKNPSYIIIAWNDLGMHCANKEFQNLCVLPPYNNQHAQVIKVGDVSSLPQILTTGYHVTFEVPGNTYSVGKTNFWTYAQALFGVALPNDTGLTGVGLSGNMTSTGNFFKIEGIPVTPYPDSDLVNEHPYQLTLIQLFDSGNHLLASTRSVIPVSNELNCVSSGCHTSEQQILNLHESVTGFNPNVKPILCANCHKDNALGMPGTPGIPAFSEVIHEKHASVATDCYKCHPGPNTQCFRDIMKIHGMTCQNCHGTVANVASSIDNGREAWLEEPSCGTVICHGSNHAPEPGKLYRNSKGHGNLYCSACHGSPHAIYNTLQPNDNIQNTNIQGYVGTLNKCVACHGIMPTGSGPHGLTTTSVSYKSDIPKNNSLLDAFPNPASETVTIPINISDKDKVRLELYDLNGKSVKLLIDQHLDAGSYKISFNSSDLKSGVYFYILRTPAVSFSKKLVITK